MVCDKKREWAVSQEGRPGEAVRCGWPAGCWLLTDRRHAGFCERAKYFFLCHGRWKLPGRIGRVDQCIVLIGIGVVVIVMARCREFAQRIV